MNLPPGWFRAAADKWAEKQARLKAAAASAPLIFDQPDKGWLDLGVEYSCIPDSMYPWKADLVKDIWKVAPSFRPAWARQVLKHSVSGEIKVVGCHVIATKVPDPHNQLYPFPVEMPTMPCNGLTFDAPNVIERHWQGDRVGDLPGEYMTFESLYSFCKAAFKERSAEELKEELLDKPAEARAKAAAARQAEHEYKQRDIQAYAQKKLDQLSELEVKEHLLGERVKPTKPMVLLGR